MDPVPPADAALVAGLQERLGMASPTVTPLTGGTRNRSYRLRDATRDVVLRVGGDHDSEYAVARESEFLAQRLAADHGLAPALLFADPATGIAVAEFVPATPWTREYARSEAGARRAGAWLGRLHALPVPPGLRRIRFLDSLVAYADRIHDDGSVSRFAEAARAVSGCLGAVPDAPCHNDLHHLNLLDAGPGLVAIDWEYAGAGDPRMDLAGYAAYHDLGEPALGALLEAYGAPARAISADEMRRARWLFEAVWYAWLELRHGLERYEPAALAQTRLRLRERLGGVPNCR